MACVPYEADPGFFGIPVWEIELAPKDGVGLESRVAMFQLSCKIQLPTILASWPKHLNIKPLGTEIDMTMYMTY